MNGADQRRSATRDGSQDRTNAGARDDARNATGNQTDQTHDTPDGDTDDGAGGTDWTQFVNSKSQMSVTIVIVNRRHLLDP